MDFCLCICFLRFLVNIFTQPVSVCSLLVSLDFSDIFDILIFSDYRETYGNLHQPIKKIIKFNIML